MLYDLFLSYRRADGASTARRIRRFVVTYRLPRPLREQYDDRRLRVYMDTAYERVAPDFWSSNIQPALEESRHLALVVTPAVFEPGQDGPNWVEREYRTFRQGQHANNISAIMVDDLMARLPFGIDQALPHLVRIRVGRSKGLFPLGWTDPAADELLKLVAALHDIAPEELPVLRREEDRRRQRRFLSIVTAVLTVSIIVTALAAFGYQQRQASQRAAADGFATAALLAAQEGRYDRAVALLGGAARLADTPLARASRLRLPPLDIHPAPSTLTNHGALVQFGPTTDRALLRATDGSTIYVRNGRSVAIDEPCRTVWSCALSPDGDTLALLDARSVVLYRFDDADPPGRRVVTLHGMSGHSVAVSNGATRLAVALGDGRGLLLVGGEDAPMERCVTGWGPRGRVVGPMAFSPDGEQLALGIQYGGESGGSGGLQIWSARNCNDGCIAEEPRDVDAPDTVQFSQTGRWVVASSRQGQGWVFPSSLEEYSGVAFMGQHGVMSPDERFLLVQEADGIVRLAPFSPGSFAHGALDRGARWRGRGPLAFGSDSRSLSVGRRPYVFDRRYDEIGPLNTDPWDPPAPDGRLIPEQAEAFRQQIRDSILQDDHSSSSVWGDLMAVLTDGQVELRHRNTDQLVGAFAHERVRFATFSPDGTLLATGSGGTAPDSFAGGVPQSGSLKVWSVATGAELFSLQGRERQDTSMWNIGAAGDPPGVGFSSASWVDDHVRVLNDDGQVALLGRSDFADADAWAVVAGLVVEGSTVRATEALPLPPEELAPWLDHTWAYHDPTPPLDAVPNTRFCESDQANVQEVPPRDVEGQRMERLAAELAHTEVLLDNARAAALYERWRAFVWEAEATVCGPQPQEDRDDCIARVRGRLLSKREPFHDCTLAGQAPYLVRPSPGAVLPDHAEALDEQSSTERGWMVVFCTIP